MMRKPLFIKKVALRRCDSWTSGRCWHFVTMRQRWALDKKGVVGKEFFSPRIPIRLLLVPADFNQQSALMFNLPGDTQESKSFTCVGPVFSSWKSLAHSDRGRRQSITTRYESRCPTNAHGICFRLSLAMTKKNWDKRSEVHRD